jgi:hypothetical protein
MGMIEVLINGEDTEVLDWGDSEYPQSDLSNYGPIQLNGAPSNYVVAVFDRFQ